MLYRPISLGLCLVILGLLAVACGDDEPIAVPSSTSTPISAAPTAAAAPVATLAPTPTATPLPTSTLEPTASATPRLIIGIAPQPTPTSTPAPTPTPTLEELRENLPPHIFIGTVLVDGLPAREGTVVTALVDGVEVASVEVKDGKYTNLQVGPAAKFVTFKIGDSVANETFVSEIGGADILNLTATRDY